MQRKISLSSRCFIWLLLLVGSTAWAEPVRFSGTGAGISAIKQVLDVYRQRHPDTQLQFLLPPMGSSGAIKALSTHQLDVALSGRPLRKEEAAAGLVEEWLGRSPFLFVVHQSSPTTNASLTQLTEMYAGRQKVWPDGSRVRVVLRPLSDADTDLLKNISPAMNEAVTVAHAHRQPGSALADTDIDLADMIEKVPGGLGSVALSLVMAEHRPLKGLILDGVEPTVASLDENRYPYAKPLFLVTRADAPASVRAISDFLRSMEGRAMLREVGISSTKP